MAIMSATATLGLLLRIAYELDEREGDGFGDTIRGLVSELRAEVDRLTAALADEEGAHAMTQNNFEEYVEDAECRLDEQTNLREHLAGTVWLVAEAFGADRECMACQKVVRHMDRRELGTVCGLHRTPPSTDDDGCSDLEVARAMIAERDRLLASEHEAAEVHRAGFAQLIRERDASDAECRRLVAAISDCYGSDDDDLTPAEKLKKVAVCWEMEHNDANAPGEIAQALAADKAWELKQEQEEASR